MGLTAYTKGGTPNDVLALFHNGAVILYVLFGIVMAYDVIVRERRERTLYTLLSKPISRGEVVIGKFFGSLLSVCVVILPVLIAGYLITIPITQHIPSSADIGSVSSYLGVIVLGIACYIALAMLMSSAVSHTTTAILSAIGAWFGLDMVYGITLMILKGTRVGVDPNLIREANSLWYVKLAYAINPGGCMNGAANNIFGLKSFMGQVQMYPLSPNSMIISMVIFLVAMMAITLVVFRSKDLT
jgi:ABC-type transport system involved in multi-copper enzyme maturation permease subunit